MPGTKKPSTTTTSLSVAGRKEPAGDKQEVDDVYDETLPTKYRGTAADKSDMLVLGKKQVLRVCAQDGLHRVNYVSCSHVRANTIHSGTSDS